MKIWISVGGFLGGLGVILGALGAHALKEHLTEQKLAAFHTGTQYQIYHSLALIMVGILAIQMGEPMSEKLNTVGWLFTAGIIMFSGSIYILTLGGPKFFGPITPLGGLAFMTGWFSLAYTFFKKNN